MIKNFVWITALFLSFTTLAQDPVYQSIDKTKGLLSNTIYDLFEDNIGRIWVAHEKGLSQYDGYRFKNYQNNQEQGLSLSNIMQDGRGRIWCQNFTGQVFYVEGDQLLLNTDLEPSGVFCKAAILSDSLLFIGHHNTIRIYNTYSKVLTEIPLENQTADQNAFATSTHYYFFNREEGKLTTIDLKGNTTMEDAPKQPYFYYLKSKHSSFYIPKFPTTGMSIIKKDDTSFQYHFPKNTLIQNTAELNDSTFSLMTSSGVYFLYDYATSANRNDTWYPNKNISCIMQDKEGNGWVGTLNEGILFIPSLKTKKKFASYTFTEIGIDKQSNELLLGSTNNEVFRYNTSTGTLKKLIQFNTVHEIKSIHHNHQNTLAIGSDRFYVVRDKQVIDQHEYSVKDIRQFSDGTYAISTSIAIALLPISKNSIYTKWPHRNNTNNKVIELTMKGVRTRAIEILNDTLYGATTQGLLSFNATQHDTIFYNGKHIMAADLHADKNKLYVATYSQGILLLEHGKITSQFTSKHKKMPAVYKIQVHKNMLWALTESDIRAFNLENHSMKIYDKANGIPTDDIRDFFILRDTLYLAGQGLIYLPISSIETKINEPTLVLNEMIVNGNKINANEALTLKSTQNDVALNFSVLSYRNIHHTTIYYRINSEPWKILNPNVRDIRLTSLSPNTYKIQIAAQIDSLQQKHPIEATFVIHPPFYKTFWFTTLTILLVITLFYRVHLWRMKQLTAKNRLEHEKIQLEQALQQSLLASIKSQMNPHFIYNALSSIQSFVYSDDKTNAIKYLDNFSSLMRNVLEMSTRETILIREEIFILETYISLEKMRFGDSFQYTIECDSEIDPDFDSIPSMIIQPFVENAIKHGLLHRKGEKILKISFQICDKHTLQVTIDDNGVGRKTSEVLKISGKRNHNSFSVSANRKRLALLNSKGDDHIGLEIIDKVDDLKRGIGTTVIITIPNVISSN